MYIYIYMCSRGRAPPASSPSAGPAVAACVGGAPNLPTKVIPD